MPLTISAQYGLIDQNEFFDKRIASKDVRGYYLIKKGEFAYNKSTSVDAPLGAIKRLDKYKNGVLSTLYILFKIIDDTSTDSDYLVTYYATDLWHRGIQSIAAEGARNHGLLNIAPNDFFETMLSIPLNVSEQKKVGYFFISLDHLITLHQSKSFGYILKVIVSCTLSWEQRKLGEIGMIITGSTPSTSLKYYYTDDSDEGIVWVTPTDIINNITVESEKRLTSLGQKVAHIVPQNTILVTCIASIGKNTMLIDRGSFNQQINGLIPYKNKYEPYFLLTESFIWSNKMKSSVPAGTMQIVNRKEFSEIDADIPNKSEQNSVGSFFRTLDHLITLHQLEPFQLIFKAIAYRIIDYAKSKPPRHTKYEIIISFIKYYA